jgi:predicted acylesterase/phospholipase RssA
VADASSGLTDPSVERGPLSRPRAIAVVLTGAATKGAFEAGVLDVLAERRLPVTRIVAASSGALNGVAYAAGVRACRERSAAKELVALWETRGGFCDVVRPSLRTILARRGLSDATTFGRAPSTRRSTVSKGRRSASPRRPTPTS